MNRGNSFIQIIYIYIYIYTCGRADFRHTYTCVSFESCLHDGAYSRIKNKTKSPGFLHSRMSFLICSSFIFPVSMMKRRKKTQAAVVASFQYRRRTKSSKKMNHRHSPPPLCQQTMNERMIRWEEARTTCRPFIVRGDHVCTCIRAHECVCVCACVCLCVV